MNITKNNYEKRKYNIDLWFYKYFFIFFSNYFNTNKFIIFYFLNLINKYKNIKIYFFILLIYLFIKIIKNLNLIVKKIK